MLVPAWHFSWCFSLGFCGAKSTLPSGPTLLPLACLGVVAGISAYTLISSFSSLFCLFHSASNVFLSFEESHWLPLYFIFLVVFLYTRICMACRLCFIGGLGGSKTMGLLPFGQIWKMCNQKIRYELMSQGIWGSERSCAEGMKTEQPWPLGHFSYCSLYSYLHKGVSDY